MHCYFFSLCLLPTFIHLLCASKPSVAVAYTPLAVNISLENDVLSLADQLDALKNAVPYISRHLMKQSPPTRSRLLKPQVRRSSTDYFHVRHASAHEPLRRLLLESHVPMQKTFVTTELLTNHSASCWLPDITLKGNLLAMTSTIKTCYECLRECSEVIQECSAVTFTLREHLCSFYGGPVTQEASQGSLSAVLQGCTRAGNPDDLACGSSLSQMLTGSQPFTTLPSRISENSFRNLQTTPNHLSWEKSAKENTDRRQSLPLKNSDYAHLATARTLGLDFFRPSDTLEPATEQHGAVSQESPSQTAYQYVGDGIDQEDCNTLCNVRVDCASYRWTSSKRLCELEMPFSNEGPKPSAPNSPLPVVFYKGAFEQKNVEAKRSVSDYPSVVHSPIQPVLPYEGASVRHADALTNLYPEKRNSNGPVGHLLNPLTQQPFGYNQRYSNEQDPNEESVEPYNSVAFTFNDKNQQQEQRFDVVQDMSFEPREPPFRPQASGLVNTEPSGSAAGSAPLRLPLLGAPLLEEFGLGRLFTGLFSPSSLVKTEEAQPSSLMHGAANALKTFQSVLAAGDTVMKTFPVADMVRAGQQMSSSGLLNLRNSAGVKGGVPLGVKDKATGATRLPKGVGSPEVSCYPQGMRCCVPHSAVAHYQTNPPLLNGINRKECTAHYVTNLNQLCVTVMYERNDCSQTVISTESATVYRNIMEISDKTMNNAICECIIPKRSTDAEALNDENQDEGTQMIPASARWQYSRGAMEKNVQTKQRLHDTAGKLGNAAKTMFFVGDVLTKPYADAETEYMADGAASFIDSLTQLGEELRQQQQRTNVMPSMIRGQRSEM